MNGYYISHVTKTMTCSRTVSKKLQTNLDFMYNFKLIDFAGYIRVFETSHRSVKFYILRSTMCKAQADIESVNTCLLYQTCKVHDIVCLGDQPAISQKLKSCIKWLRA